MSRKNNRNSIDLENWRECIGDITTNSRWLSSFNEKPLFGNFLIPKRSEFPKPDGEHHGIWIAEIPYQMMSRFTKEGDVVWSQFGGSGIDFDVAEKINRRCIVNDINPKRDFIQEGDSRTFQTNEELSMILSHPPYWDMVKYSTDESDGSSKKTLVEFLTWWDEILENSVSQLKDNGHFILACGNMFKNGEEIELGEILKNMVLSKGFVLKQHIIKDYGETKGSEAKNYNLNYYRQLKGGYGNFYGDNIFVLKKMKSKNNIVDLIKQFI